MTVTSLDARLAQRDGGDPETEFFTLPEVAGRARVSLRTFYNLFELGAGPRVVHIGRSVRVRRADFEAWVEGLPECVYNKGVNHGD